METIIAGYKPCNKEREKYCAKYGMLICCDCPHGIKVEKEEVKEK